MSLPSRLLVVSLMVTGFCGCATHDRLAYEHDYWRGRNLPKAEEKAGQIDAETQARLDAAAAGRSGAMPPGTTNMPAVPGNTGLPQSSPFGAPAPTTPTTPAPATPPSSNPFEAPPASPF